ncbi:MAG: metal-dependent hydrolase [Desulfovibrionaceae bacterium]|nr:metal-dependent hydrolase [Desulfovibrionaceae bacterium]
MTDTLTWHGHSNFQIAAHGVNILIDPFFEGNPKADTPWRDIAKPDLILVTHDHGDHVGQCVEIATATGAHVCAVVETAGKLAKLGVPGAQIVNGIGFNVGGTVEFKGARITMVQAFHSSESGVPVGYIVVLPSGVTLYHAGDTGVFSSMALWGSLYDIDYALLPVGGVFTMDARQAALASLLTRATRVVPMHWGTFPVLAASTEAFRAEVAERTEECEVVEMRPGETIELVRG